jgi:PRTRC genetic system ThiF family protein
MLMRLVKIDAALKAFGHQGLDVRCCDPDTVSEANLGRQAFFPVDIGRNKAVVLVERVNAYFGLTWVAAPRRYDGPTHHSRVVVSCVDSHAARLAIGKDLKARSYDSPRYWLDLGNTDRTGQVVLGEVSGHEYRYRLPTIIDLFGENAPADDDTTPSCSLQEALARQDLFINELVVAWASDLLWKLFREPSIGYSAVFVSAFSGMTRTLPIDAKEWLRFGHRTSRRKPRYVVQN